MKKGISELPQRLYATVALLMLLLTGQALAAEARNLAVSKANSATGGQRFALVIGNDTYQHVSPLRNARADARAIARALEKTGFSVTLLLDAGDKDMKGAVRQFKNQLGGGDEAVFYFSGHGVQMGAANYLLPVDIHGDSEDQVKDEALPLQRVLDDLQDQKTRFSLAVIDACRNNPFKSAGRAIGGRGLVPTSPATGQMVLYSAGAGQQALDNLGENDKDPNGIFTRAFLKEMDKPGIPVEKVLRNVREEVVRMARSVKHEQVPALYDQMLGEFYFRAGQAETGESGGAQVASLVPVPAPARIKSKEEIEQDSWDSARDSGSISSIQEYLKQYPKGRFVGQAKILIANLKSAPSKPAEPAITSSPAREDNETALWTEAQKGNSRDDYDAYLGQYPKGKYVALAKSRIKKLQDEAAAEASRKEQDAWQAADQSGNEDGYQDYLKGWPSGKYAGLAQVRLRKLQADLAAARQKKLEEEAAQQAKQEREAAARQEAERKRKQAETPKGYVSQGGLTWMPVTFKKEWDEANSYCANTTIRGQTGWRLPTKDELVALYNSGAAKGQGWTLDITWSSTPYTSGSRYVVFLDIGGVSSINAMDINYVTCVR